MKYEYFNTIIKEYFDSCEDLRFGQFFVINYVDKNATPWPELFYEKNIKKAIDKAYQYFVDTFYDEEE
mgnify:CR=1 FL=1